MSSSIQCPACKFGIDGDSLYCDQCGSQILVCSVCGRPGKGKRCMFDGKELVIPGGTSQSSSSTVNLAQPSAPAPSAPAPSPMPASAPVQSAQAPAPAASVSFSGGNKIKLSSQSNGAVIDASEGDILGRTKGNFTGILGKFSHISGNHCQIIKVNGAWSIKDLGSTNGTFYNGTKINPNSSMPVQNNGIVKIADIEFRVTFEQANNGGTERI